MWHSHVKRLSYVWNAIRMWMIINLDFLQQRIQYRKELWWDRSLLRVHFNMILNQLKRVYKVMNPLYKIHKVKLKLQVLIKEVYLIHLIC